MTTRALRGWGLGNPIPITDRREMGDWAMCECSYQTPYLHSLVVTWFHWPKPILQIPQESAEAAAEWCRELHGFAPSTVRIRPKSKSPARIDTPPGSWSWNVFGQSFGGFFSYNPDYIDRMGKWEEVRVLGVTTLFGDIVEHERGYRSEGVRIDRLWVLYEAAARFKKSRLRAFLEDTYRCEVTILRKKLYEGFYDWITKEDIRNLL